MRNKDKEFIETVKAPALVHDEDDYEYNDEGELVLKKYVGEHARNPNDANQHTPDPRQELTWRYYINSLARGVPNAKKAALMAGYSEKFSGNVVNCKWFKDKKRKLRQKNAITRAEKNLFKIMDIKWSNMKILENGDEIEEVDIDKVKVVKDVSTFVLETLGKDEGYTKKIEEEKNIKHDIQIESVSYADAIEVPQEAQQNIIDVVTEEIQNE